MNASMWPVVGRKMSPRGSFGFADRKSTRLNSSHSQISYAVFCLTKINVQSGEVRVIPAEFPVNAYPLRVVDGMVVVHISVPTRELEIGRPRAYQCGKWITRVHSY